MDEEQQDAQNLSDQDRKVLRMVSEIATTRLACTRLLYSKSEHRSADLTGLKKILEREAANLPQSKQFLAKERYILYKLKYKMGGTFRKHRYFQMMKRIAKYVERLCTEIQPRESLLPFAEDIFLNPNDTLYCPTREQLDFCLARLVCAAYFLVEIRRFCRICASHSGQQLTIEHFIPPNLVLLGTVATVWARAGDFLKSLFQIYALLYCWRQKIRPHNLPTCSNGVERSFPSTLVELDFVSAALDSLNTTATKTQQELQSAFFTRLLNDNSELFKRAVVYQSIFGKTQKESVSDLDPTNRSVPEVDLKPKIRVTKLLEEENNPKLIQQKVGDLKLEDKLLQLKKLAQLKKFYRYLKGRARTASTTEKKKFEKALRLIKDKWTDLFSFRTQNKVRLFRENLSILKNDLCKVLL